MKFVPAKILTFISGGTVRSVLRERPGNAAPFRLRYVRSGPLTATPTVVIPGGPGLGAIVPYRGLRRFAETGGLDLIFIDHRGVGLSRNDVTGVALTHDDMTVNAVLDDIASVLDQEGVKRAFIAGSSYGSYLASSFGARYPDRVSGMLLDSALQSTEDLRYERERIRTLFAGVNSGISDSDDDQISKLIATIRSASQLPERVLLDTVRAAYELGGASFLTRILNLRVRKQRSISWWALEQYAKRDEDITNVPYYYEFARAGAIGFRELNYGAEPDGLLLDPALTYAPLRPMFPAFAGEPYDLRDEIKQFIWPVVTLVGENDVRTPPIVAERVAKTAPAVTSISINNGHSALDTHPVAFMNAVRFLTLEKSEQLKHLGPRFDALPKRGLAAFFLKFLQVCCSLESYARTTQRISKKD